MVKSKRGTDPRNPHPKKKVKKVEKLVKKVMTPLEQYVFDSYQLAKRMIAGYVIRSAKKKLGLKQSQPLFRSRNNEALVAELKDKFCQALTEEVHKVAGWE